MVSDKVQALTKVTWSKEARSESVVIKVVEGELLLLLVLVLHPQARDERHGPGGHQQVDGDDQRQGVHGHAAVFVVLQCKERVKCTTTIKRESCMIKSLESVIINCKWKRLFFFQLAHLAHHQLGEGHHDNDHGDKDGADEPGHEG